MPAKGRGKPADRAEATEIVLHIASDKTREFEAMFEAEEIPIWDDFTRRGRVQGGSEGCPAVQDYILHVIAADHQAHEEHDSDPRFQSFLEKAQRIQPHPPLVWFGETVFERRS